MIRAPLSSMLYDAMTAEPERACLRGWRSELLRDLHGTVLEIGPGTGANLGLYPREVDHLVLVEPDAAMRQALATRLAATTTSHRSTILGTSLEDAPLAEASFDAAVSTLVLCSVPDLDAACRALWRLIKPGGCLVYLEHGAAAPESTRLAWQRRLEPLWRRMASNCHLTRRSDDALVRAGFVLESCHRASMRRAMPLVRPTVRGIARKPR